MNDRPHDAASHYDRVTDGWALLLGDDLHYGVFETGTEALADATCALTQLMVEQARLEDGGSVLDVGCGTGTAACQLAANYGVRVTGITTSALGIARATERAAREQVAGRVSFEKRDGTDSGLPAESFDRVWVLESSHLMRDRGRLIGECTRVLKPGGRLVLCDIMLQRPMPFEEVRRLHKPLALLRAAFGDARMELPSEYARLAQEHGLTVDAELDLTAATSPTFDRWRTNAEGHRDAVIERIGEVEWQGFVDALPVLEGFWEDGTLGYGLLAADKPG